MASYGTRSARSELESMPWGEPAHSTLSRTRPYAIMPRALVAASRTNRDMAHDQWEQEDAAGSQRWSTPKETLAERAWSDAPLLPETSDLLRQQFAELSLWPLPDQTIVETYPILDNLDAPSADGLLDPHAAIEQRRVALATAVRVDPAGNVSRVPLHTGRRIQRAQFDLSENARLRATMRALSLRGSISEKRDIVVNGADLVSIERSISSGTAQGEVFSALVRALPVGAVRYTSAGRRGGGTHMRVEAALKKSAITEKATLARINSARRVMAGFQATLASGRARLPAREAGSLASLMTSGEWPHDVVDDVFGIDWQALMEPGARPVVVQPAVKVLDAYLAEEEDHNRHEVADPGAEPKVDTVLAYANSVLVEQRVSPGFALYYGSCVALDTGEIDRTAREGIAAARRDEAINAGSTRGLALRAAASLTAEQLEAPIVEVLVTQQLDGSVNQLVKAGWYGGRKAGVAPNYARIVSTLANVTQALLAMQAHYNEVHNDLHAGNVLYEIIRAPDSDEPDPDHYQYYRVLFAWGRAPLWLAVPDEGLAPRLIDFGRSTARLPMADGGGVLNVTSTVAGEVLAGRRDLYSRSVDLITFARAFVGYIGGDLMSLVEATTAEREAYLAMSVATPDEAHAARVMWRMLDRIFDCGAEGNVWRAGTAVCEMGQRAVRSDPVAAARIVASFGRNALAPDVPPAKIVKRCFKAADLLAPFEAGTSCVGGEPLAQLPALAELYAIDERDVPADAIVYTVTVPESMRTPTAEAAWA